jgi:hypothetical protein
MRKKRKGRPDWTDWTDEQKRQYVLRQMSARTAATHQKMREELDELVRFTHGCREDMHEPDEQGIDAHIVGNHLDNAFGNGVVKEMMDEGCQEFVVILENENTDKQMKINLANLIALARKAVI